MADEFEGYASGLTSPATRHTAITPSDSVDLDPRPRALRINVGGNIAIRDREGTDITYAVIAGEILPFRGVRVLATGTTATGIVGWD